MLDFRTQPQRPADLLYFILLALRPQQPFERQYLVEQLKKEGIKDLYSFFLDACKYGLLVEHPAAPGSSEKLLSIGDFTLCPAPDFFEIVRRRPDPPKNAPVGPALAGGVAGPVARSVVAPAAPPAGPPPSHSLAAARFTYFRAGQSQPHGDITLRQLYRHLTGPANSHLAKLTAAARLLVGTPYYEALWPLQDYALFGSCQDPEHPGGLMLSGLFVLTLELDPVKTTRAEVQRQLRADVYLREALLLLFADPDELRLTLVLTAPISAAEAEYYDPRTDFEYGPRCNSYLSYFSYRYRDEGFWCLSHPESGCSQERICVWHDPQAILGDGL